MIPHYEVTGDGPPLVLSNSLGATLQMWNPNVRALAKHFQVIRYDTRGHGRSDVPPGPYTIDDAGNDVGELLDHLGHERAHFVGLSLGGMTGQWLAMHAPARIEKLVLLCTSPRLGPPKTWADRAKLVREQGTEAILDATFERWFTEGYRAKHPLKGLRRMFAGVPDEGYASCCAIIEKMDLTDGLPNISAPTLVIAGAVPGARLEVLDPGAHLINVERAGAVNKLILEHLR